MGREHIRVHRSNQDAVALHADGHCVVAVVADGCSSGRYSEIGARLGAEWLARWIPRLLTTHGNTQQLIDVATTGLLQFLGSTTHALDADPDHLPQLVADHLLFTFLAAVITPETTQIFGAGDGVWSHNGSLHTLDPGPDNAPAYLAYRLLPHAPHPPVTVHHRGATTETQSLLLATDGLSDLDPTHTKRIETNPHYRKNPYALQRQLVVWGANENRLPDDTTVALVTRHTREDEEARPCAW